MVKIALVLILILLVPFEALAGYDEAMANLQAGNVDAAKSEIILLAQKGDGRAQYSLGQMYLIGGMPGVSKDVNQAIIWLRKSADQGIGGAEFQLGEMYRSGIGVTKDTNQAVLWYQKVAEKDNFYASQAKSWLHVLKAQSPTLNIEKNDTNDKATAESIKSSLPALTGNESPRVQAAAVEFKLSDKGYEDSHGYSSEDTLASKKTWPVTGKPPLGIYAIGWGTALLSNGSVLGVGNANIGRHSAAFLYDTKANEWSATRDIPDGIVGLGPSMTQLQNGVVLALGSDSDRNSVALLFDPVSKQWSTTGPLPSKFIGNGKKMVLLSTGDVLVLGDAVHNVGWLYNYKNNIWFNTEKLPIQVAGFPYATAISNGQVLVIAEDNSSITKRWVGILYEPANKSWTLTGNMPTALQGSTTNATILSDGSILVSGFQSAPSAFVALLYNPKSNTWTETGTLPKETIEIKAAKLLPNGSVLAISSNVLSNELTGLLFNPIDNKWEKTGFMPAGLIGIKLNGVLPDGTVWAIGRRNNLQSDELIYSPTQKSWTAIGKLPNGIIHVSSPIRTNGTVLLFAGPNDGSRSSIDNVVLYLP